MNIEDLRRVRNKNVAQQNELTFLEMKSCADSFDDILWLNELLAPYSHSKNTGLLIRLRSVPDQIGTMWYGTWLDTDKRFYEFEVLTNRESTKIIDVESWQKVSPEICEHKKGVGKTYAYIGLELLTTYEKS